MGGGVGGGVLVGFREEAFVGLVVGHGVLELGGGLCIGRGGHKKADSGGAFGG